MIGASGLRLLDNYPAMKREYDEVSVHNLWLQYRKWTGEDLGSPFQFGRGAKGSQEYSFDKPPQTTVLRPMFHAMLHHQLQRLGIKVKFGMNVRSFYEDLECGVGGVVTEQGEKFEADLVVAADGLHSKSRSLIPNAAADARPAGRTVYRCAFPLEAATADPIVAKTFGLHNGIDPRLQVWLGPETHAVVLAYVDKNGTNGRLCFGLNFREDVGTETKESWDKTVVPERVLSLMDRLPGWGEAMKRLMLITPANHIVAWPLIPRSPNPQWHSPGGRVLQVGDAAHPFLPTSGNGATQAIEDAITIAACLANAGKDRISAAVRVHNLIRFDRVSCAQLLGFVNAARVEKTDFDEVGKDPTKVQHKTPKWLWSCDAEKYANESYEAAAVSLLPGGKEFKNTNIPAGYIPMPWTVDQLEAMQEAGQPLELEGDWS